MKYRIYELTKPHHLQDVELDGHEMRTINRYVLEETKILELNVDFYTPEEAMSALGLHGENFRDYTIQPYISIRNFKF